VREKRPEWAVFGAVCPISRNNVGWVIFFQFFQYIYMYMMDYIYLIFLNKIIDIP
jgi:hypothetical protein